MAITAAAGLALAGTAAFHPAANASSPGHPRVLATAAYSGSSAGSYIIGAENLDSSDPFNDYGIEGKVSNDVGGVGVLGYGQQAKSYGLYGVTFGSNGIGVYGAGDGPTPAPGMTPSSATETTGVVGDSHGGDGVFGTTEWSSASNPATNAVAGVYGVDNAATGFTNDGVYGATTAGAFGVSGFAGDTAIAGIGGSSSKAVGVQGTSASSFGVSGLSTSSYGVYGSSSTLAGVFGTSPADVGVLGQSAGGLAEGVAGENTGSGVGVAGTSQTGNGVFAMSSETTTENAALLAQGGKVSIESIASTAVSSTTTSYPLIAYSSDGTQLFTVTNTGEVDIEGNLRVHGTTGTYTRTRDAQVALHEYTAASSRPTTEDIGQGRVVDGIAYVRLDPTFAQGIDTSAPYAVFVTPNGDTKGFYVTGKSVAGFTVRETQGGRSTWDFDYRIVATQYGETARRVAAVRESDANLAPRRTAFVAPALRASIEAASPKVSPKELALQKSLADPFAHRAFGPRPNYRVEHRSQ